MHAIAPYARTAYAQGWAMSGGPMTDRVKAGCVAAVEYAIGHEHDHDVIEATLRLGHLEGTWAKIYQRRDSLLADVHAKTAATWRGMVQQLDLSGIIRWYRSGAGLAAETADPIVNYSIQTARTMLHALPDTNGYTQLRQELGDAILTAEAEGAVGALALGADKLSQVGFSYDLAFEHVYEALGKLNAWTEADSWLTQIVNGAAGDLGRRLAPLVRDQASYDDMLAAAADVLDNEDVRAVSTVVDMAVHQGLTTGAMDLWSREGVDQVDFLTAGDARVCPICDKAEADSPFNMAERPPRPPLHPLCRCTLSAVNPIRLSTLTPFLEVV